MLKRSSLKHSQSAVLWEHHNEEVNRLVEDKNLQVNWREWGPYLSERQWGTVREDYSHDGNCWDYLPHDHARSRAYRWGEDGLLGITDRECRLCFALALWNEKDAILKERLFGLNEHEGNHGEDVKECYYYLDGTPTHSYMKALYKYPQNEFPYEQLVKANRERSKTEPEFELIDTGVFDEGRYWDVTTEYAKSTPNCILINITVANRGTEHARLHLLPTLWFKNTWSWGCKQGEATSNKPVMWKLSRGTVLCEHDTLGLYILEYQVGQEDNFPEVLFTDNETNSQRLFNVPNATEYQKDAFNRYIVNEESQAVNPANRGTKAAVYYVLLVPPGGHYTVRLRLSSEAEHVRNTNPFAEKVFGGIVEKRRKECERFYKAVIPGNLSAEETSVCRQAYAGLVWNKQFYHYVVRDWLQGDPGTPSPPSSRLSGRNSSGWLHMYSRDVVSTADKWEYPYFASWNLAFHLILFAKIDPEFSKNQLLLLLSDRYMSTEGQIPAYEFELSDVSPPVYALVCWRIYTLSERHGHRDEEFLAKCFQKLHKNFSWSINRKDPKGRKIFCGGLDNIASFDSFENVIQQSVDGPAWMATYCVTMLHITLQLALTDPSYEELACKFLNTFVDLADIMTEMSDGMGFWDSADGFYYDHLKCSEGDVSPLRVRSMVGLVPLVACFLIDDEYIEKLPNFRERIRWFVENRTDLSSKITFMDPDSESKYHHLLAIPTPDQLKTILGHMLNENEFLSPFGIRTISKYHKENPYVLSINGREHRVEYVPSECTTQTYRSNSNWRGPLWLALNFVIIEALDRYGLFYGDRLKVEYPTGSGHFLRLREVSQEISRRVSQLFLPNEWGMRPCHGDEARYAHDVMWKKLVLFYEYFDPDTGRGCGASHFTGGTALVSKLLDKVAAKLK